MISQVLRITLSLAIVCYFILILHYLKRKRIDLKYTLIWIFAGIIMGIMIFFPGILFSFSHLLGIESSMNGLYVLCIAFIIATLMTLTSIVSGQNAKIRMLIQQIAILEKRIREIEESDKKTD